MLESEQSGQTLTATDSIRYNTQVQSERSGQTQIPWSKIMFQNYRFKVDPNYKFGSDVTVNEHVYMTWDKAKLSVASKT